MVQCEIERDVFKSSAWNIADCWRDMNQELCVALRKGVFYCYFRAGKLGVGLDDAAGPAWVVYKTSVRAWIIELNRRVFTCVNYTIRNVLLAISGDHRSRML